LQESHKVDVLVGKITWDLFLLETKEIFLTFFSLLYHFLILNKEMQLGRQFTMVISQLGEMLIRIPTKRACLKNQAYGKWNVHNLKKQKTKIEKCIPTFFVI